MYSLILFGIIGVASLYVLSTLRAERKAPTQSATFETKFAVILEKLNKLVFNNKGKLTALTPHNYILYIDGGDQSVNFNYLDSKLIVTWQFQYNKRDFSHTEEFDSAVKSTIFKQEKWVNNFSYKLANLRQEFKYSILSKQALHIK